MRNPLARAPRDWHDRLLVEVAAAIHPRCYVEVGIYRAETLNKIARFCDGALGLDINPEAEKYVDSRVARFVLSDLMKSTNQLDAAMSEVGSTEIDMAFIDGDHRSEAAMNDFAVIAARASDRALIALHDTWPKDAAHADDRFCSDSYRLPRLIAERFEGEWSSVTIPTHPGLTLCTRTAMLPQWLSD